jgi:hypothetical protein
MNKPRTDFDGLLRLDATSSALATPWGRCFYPVLPHAFQQQINPNDSYQQQYDGDEDG